MTSAVCTICNGAYWWGAGALANSLYATGYRGELWVGYVGELPAWLKDRRSSHSQLRKLTGDFALIAHGLRSDVHLAHQKPDLMLAMLDARADLDRVMFFDADMVAICASVFSKVGLTGQSASFWTTEIPYLHEMHPWRKEWSRLIEDLGWPIRSSSQYFQSALQNPREYKVFLDRWQRIIASIHQKYPGSRDRILMETRAHPYHIVDQDAMSVAVMATDVPLTVMGVEALGNGQTSYLAQHPRLHFKPWNFQFIRRALSGWGPADPYELLFLRHCREVINMMSTKEQRRRILELRIGQSSTGCIGSSTTRQMSFKAAGRDSGDVRPE